MPISWEALALSATTSATLTVVTQNHLPIWVLVAMWLLGATVSIINTEKVTKKSAITTLITGASASAVLTNIIVDKVFTNTSYHVEISIWIAIILWLFWHLFFAKIWARKEEIVDMAVSSAVNKVSNKTK